MTLPVLVIPHTALELNCQSNALLPSNQCPEVVVTLLVLPINTLVVLGLSTSRKFTLAPAANSCVALAVRVTWAVVNVALAPSVALTFPETLLTVTVPLTVVGLGMVPTVTVPEMVVGFGIVETVTVPETVIGFGTVETVTVPVMLTVFAIVTEVTLAEMFVPGARLT